MLVVEEILELLKDGKWRDLDEIMEKTRISKRKVEIVTSFLEKYGFIQLDKERGRAKLTLAMFTFFNQQIEPCSRL